MTDRLYYIANGNLTQEQYFGKGVKALQKIAVVNDISGFGRCSLTAALPVLSALGTECCPLPTAILSNQTGYDSFYCDDFTDRLDAYIAGWRRLGARFDGILTGYLASPLQADKILGFIEEFKTGQTLYVCDPVMADDGRVYDTYDDALCRKVAELAKQAEVITPNLTELCLLAGDSYTELIAHSGEPDYEKYIVRIAETLLSRRTHTVVITGVCVGDSVRNLLVQKDGVSVISSRRFGGSYSGTGDLFSAVLTGEMVRGKSAVSAVRKAVRFLEVSIEESFRAGTDRNDGVNFQNHLEMLFDEVQFKK